MNGMTDIHQHILWGMDDGPDRPEVMHAMLRRAHQQDVRRIIATPHACPGFQPFDMDIYRQRLQEARDYCDENGLDITLMQGAEVAWTYNAVEALRRKQLPTLNDTDHVLIEFWESVSLSEVRSALEKLLRAGFTPIIAHVERYRCFAWQPGRAIALRNEMPVSYQVNASTVISPRGPVQRYFIDKMLASQAVDAVASDAHNCSGRPLRLRKAYKVLSERWGEDYARALVNYDGVLK